MAQFCTTKFSIPPAVADATKAMALVWDFGSATLLAVIPRSRPSTIDFSAHHTFSLDAFSPITTAAKTFSLMSTLARSAALALAVLLGPSAKAFVLQMFAVISEQLKVLDAVVGTIAVDVVDDFLGCKRSSKVLFHHETVFPHIRISSGFWMIWGINLYVPTRHHDAPFRLASLATAETRSRIKPEPMCPLPSRSVVAIQAFSARFQRQPLGHIKVKEFVAVDRHIQSPSCSHYTMTHAERG